MILNVEKVSKDFGGMRAVDGVSFALEQGEISSIIGPNGAGKTTLFNVLTGQLEKTSGKVIFKGEDISKLPPYQIVKRRIGRSFQLLNIFQRMTVYENIQTAMLAGRGLILNMVKPAKHQLRDEAEELLGRIGLSRKATEIAGDLSHGEQRRLELGIALANRPELVFLDEPCAGLTSEETRSMVQLIRELAGQQELTVLIVEHKMEMVFSISKKIRVLYEGRLIFEGHPEEVRRSEIVQRVYLGEERDGNPGSQ